MTVKKPKPKQLLRPITTGTNSAMSQSHFLAIICNSLEAREKSRVHGGIGFAFASHWLKNCHDSFKPITKRSNPNHIITFDSHLKTAQLPKFITLLHDCMYILGFHVTKEGAVEARDRNGTSTAHSRVPVVAENTKTKKL